MNTWHPSLSGKEGAAGHTLCVGVVVNGLRVLELYSLDIRNVGVGQQRTDVRGRDGGVVDLEMTLWR